MLYIISKFSNCYVNICFLTIYIIFMSKIKLQYAFYLASLIEIYKKFYSLNLIIFYIFLQKKNQPFLIDFRIRLFNLVWTDSLLVQMAGIEPARIISPQDFKSCASASSATSAFWNWLLSCDNDYYNILSVFCQYIF